MISEGQLGGGLLQLKGGLHELAALLPTLVDCFGLSDAKTMISEGLQTF